METKETKEIVCACGAVAVELRGEPLIHIYCHCDDCQAAHGLPYVPVVIFPKKAVRVLRGDVVEPSVKTTPRTTCAACGTRMFASPPSAPIRGVIASLLPAGYFQPKLHIFCTFALAPVQDGLPHYRKLPAALGGTDETVEW